MKTNEFIINKMVENFFNAGEYEWYEYCDEFKLSEYITIELECYESESFSDKNIYMTFTIHNNKPGHNTWHKCYETKIGAWWMNDDGDGGIDYYKDTTIKGKISAGVKSCIKYYKSHIKNFA